MGLRTLAFSYRDFSEEQFEEVKEATKDFTAEDSAQFLESDNTLLAIVALKDPLRERVANVVKFSEKGGVNIRMITSNSLDTAKAIAVEAGILPKDLYAQSIEQ